MRPSIDLGDIARDTITGYEGVVICRTDWMNGCTRLTLQAKTLHDGKPVDSYTVDIEQLDLVTSASPSALSATGGDRVSPTRASDPARR